MDGEEDCGEAGGDGGDEAEVEGGGCQGLRVGHDGGECLMDEGYWIAGFVGQVGGEVV